MTSVREQLATALAPLLGEDVAIIHDPRSVATLDPTPRYTVQIVRDGYQRNPTAPQAQYIERMSVWVLTPLKEQPAAEDHLDEITLEVTDALQSLDATAWDDAQRLTHPEGHHAYRVTATYTTQKE